MDCDINDPKLDFYKEKLLMPIFYEDANLGKFQFDKSVDWFSATYSNEPYKYEIVFDTSEIQELKLLIGKYGKHVSNFHKDDATMRAYLASELFTLKNDFWLEDDEEEMTQEAFAERVALDSIVVYSDGSYVYWFNDGDIFYGHSLTVNGDFEKGIQEARMGG